MEIVFLQKKFKLLKFKQIIDSVKETIISVALKNEEKLLSLNQIENLSSLTLRKSI